MQSVKGKRVLVTGGAQGIGYHIADAFGARGAELVLTDIAEKALEEASKTLSDKGYRVATYHMDVTSKQQIREVHAKIREDLGPIEVLVNNAGTVFGGPFLEVPLERHELTYKINTIGLVSVTHCFLPDLIETQDAHVVNVASASGFLGLPYGSSYASSKWAAIGFSESLRLELRAQGNKQVHVTTVCPSYVDTGLFEGVKAPLMTPMLKPQPLAKTVVKAVLRNKAFVRAPLMVKFIPLMKGLLPVRAVDWVAAKLGVSRSMASWKGHA